MAFLVKTVFNSMRNQTTRNARKKFLIHESRLEGKTTIVKQKDATSSK
jgi:hypothetical protein